MPSALIDEVLEEYGQMTRQTMAGYLPKGKRRVFQAEDPERLLSLGEEKQLALAGGNGAHRM